MKITVDRAVLEMALEALKFPNYSVCSGSIRSTSRSALREALAQPQQEPVVAGVFDERLGSIRLLPTAPILSEGQQLYTSPPARKPLTDGQYLEIGQRHWLTSSRIAQIHKEIYEATEAAHGIKDTP